MKHGSYCILMALATACGGRSTMEAWGSTEAGGSGGSGFVQTGGTSAGGHTGGSPAAPSWEKVEWSEVTVDGNMSILSLFSTAQGDAWAVTVGVGFRQAIFHRGHWNGKGFAVTAMADGDDYFSFSPVWALPSGEAYSPGYRGLQAWNGKHWSERSNGSSCSAVAGTSENDLWCAEGTQMAQWDGRSWARFEVRAMSGVFALARDAVWAFGDAGIMHFDGAEWSAQSAEVTISLSASDRSTAWAVTRQGDLLRFDGRAWLRVDDIPTQAGKPLLSVWTRNQRDAWAVGENTVLRWNGSAWSVVPDMPDSVFDAVAGSDREIWLGGYPKSLHGRAVDP